jgi:hypothetical protein
VVTAVTALAVIAPGPVLGAIPRIDIGTEESCARGEWPDGTLVTFTLEPADPAALGQEVPVTADGGEAIACFDPPMSPGDQLTVAADGEARSITIERLAFVTIDRVADVVRVAAPAGRRVRVRVDRCLLSEGFSPACADALLRKVIATGGTAAIDTTGSLDLRGFDLVTAIMRNATGDRYLAFRAVPVFFVSEVGRPFIGGRMPPGPAVPFRLREVPRGAVLATTTLGDDDAPGRFQDAAGDVPIMPGNAVVGDFARDAKMRVPAMITLVDPATDRVEATCFRNGAWAFNAFASGGRDGGELRGTAAADGSIVIETAGTIDLENGHDLRLRCMTGKGDAISHTLTVP